MPRGRGPSPARRRKQAPRTPPKTEPAPYVPPGFCGPQFGPHGASSPKRPRQRAGGREIDLSTDPLDSMTQIIVSNEITEK